MVVGRRDDVFPFWAKRPTLWSQLLVSGRGKSLTFPTFFTSPRSQLRGEHHTRRVPNIPGLRVGVWRVPARHRFRRNWWFMGDVWHSSLYTFACIYYIYIYDIFYIAYQILNVKYDMSYVKYSEYKIKCHILMYWMFDAIWYIWCI